MMKNLTSTATLFFILSLLLFFTGCAHQPSGPHPDITTTPVAGIQLPAISLTSPTDESTRNYLGLSTLKTDTFSPAEIECDILLVEIFSMYCPFCQREAPDVNELFQLMQDDPKLSQKIKLIGIGVGNSAFEVGIFKTKYAVEFPLFADDNFAIHKQIGQVRTPFFIAVSNLGKNKNQVILTKLGGFSSPEKFLRSITKLINPSTAGEK